MKQDQEEFVNGTIHQFPAFDDPRLNDEGISFPDPGGFDAEYRKRHPNDWSAVSWEYPAIMLNWLEGAKAAGSTDSNKVLKALKDNQRDIIDIENLHQHIIEHRTIKNFPGARFEQDGKKVLELVSEVEK